MNKLMTGALAAGLSIVFLAGCSDSGSPSPSPSASASDGGVSAPTATATGSTTPVTTTTAPAGGVDQSTPEAAMTSWLNALVSGRGDDICSLTAVNGKRVSDVANGQEQCTKSLAPIADSLKPLASVLKGLTITGATVQGDTASFDNATTTPELAAGAVKPFKAVKIDGKWYVTTT